MKTHNGGSPDPESNVGVPLEMPLGAIRPEALTDTIARMVRQAVADEKHEEMETIEEADDFDMDDESLLLDMSPYTLDNLPDDDLIQDPTPTPPPDEPAVTPTPAPPGEQSTE